MKRLLFGLAFTGGLAASVGATKHLVSADVVRGEIARAVAAAVGGPVRIEGDVKVEVFPTVKVRFENARVIADGDQRPIAEAKELSVGLEVLSLFVGRLNASDITLRDPVLRFDRSFTLDGFAPSRTALKAMRPSRIVVENGRVELADRDTGRVETLDGVAGSFYWPRVTSASHLTATFRWRGEAAAVAYQGLGPHALADGEAGETTLSVTTAAGRVRFDGKGLLADRLQLDGALDVAAEDLGRVAAWLGFPVTSGPVFRDFALSGRMRSLGFAATVADAHMRLDGNAGEGVISVRLDAPRPQVRGTLAYDSLDLGPYSAAGWAREWRDLPLVGNALAQIDLDLRLSANHVRAATLTTERVAATLLAKAGRFDAEIGEASLFGGSAGLILRGEALPDGLRVNGRLTGRAMAIPAIIEATGMPAAEDGRLSFTLEGEAAGTTLGALADDLRGRFLAEARQVVVKSLETAASGMRYLPIGLQNAGRVPTFERCVAEIEIGQRLATVRRLDADGANLSARLAGEARLGSGALALRGRIAMADRYTEFRAGTQPQRVEIPVRIGGTLARPTAAIVTADTRVEGEPDRQLPAR